MQLMHFELFKYLDLMKNLSRKNFLSKQNKISFN